MSLYADSMIPLLDKLEEGLATTEQPSWQGKSASSVMREQMLGEIFGTTATTRALAKEGELLVAHVADGLNQQADVIDAAAIAEENKGA
jgi:hypothetical protein